MRKTKKKDKETSLLDSAKAEARAGGAATASGMNFQAAVTAIAVIHLARGTSVGWLEGLADDVPVVGLQRQPGRVTIFRSNAAPARL